MKKISKSTTFLIALLTLLVVFPLGTTNLNYAKPLINKPIMQNLQGEKLIYSFEIIDKLKGNGEIALSLENEKLNGIATGIGMSCQCNVDFNTNISGVFDKSGKNIEVTVEGIGKPIGIIIPGKITFSGPLKGIIANNYLNLTGKVNINGKLAKLGGFKEQENIMIKIQLQELVEKLEKKSNQIVSL